MNNDFSPNKMQERAELKKWGPHALWTKKQRDEGRIKALTKGEKRTGKENNYVGSEEERGSRVPI